MRLYKHLNYLLPIGVLSLVACNGSSSSSTTTTSGADIVLTPSSLVLTPGESKEIIVSVADGDTLSSAQTINISNTDVQYAIISSTPSTCTLSSTLRSCIFKVTALSTLGATDLSVSNTGNASLSVDVVKLTVAESVVAISIPQTGQLFQMPTGCPDNGVSCVISPYGSDGYGRLVNSFNIPYGVTWAYNGDMSLNPTKRFTDGAESSGQPCPTGEETRIDNLTGLMWVQDLHSSVIIKLAKCWIDDSGANEALQAIADLNAAKFCGYDDWRLPNVNELASVVNYGAIDTSVWLNKSEQGFYSVQPDIYWTSTIAFPDSGFSSQWAVDMLSGTIYQKSTGYTPVKKSCAQAYVWPVRGGE